MVVVEGKVVSGTDRLHFPKLRSRQSSGKEGIWGHILYPDGHTLSNQEFHHFHLVPKKINKNKINKNKKNK